MFRKLKTLKVKFPIISFFTYLTLVVVILAACYVRFYRIMVDNYTTLGEEVLELASQEINIDHIPDYLNGDLHGDEYDITAEKLNSYVECIGQVYYLYAYQIDNDEPYGRVIFDADTEENGEGDALGSVYELEKDIVANVAAYRRGAKMQPLIDNTEWGFLLTCSVPLIDSDGVCQGFLFADFNMTDIRDANRGFIANLFVLVFGLMLVILYLGMKAVAVRITVPIEKIYLCLKRFKFETEDDRLGNVQSLKALNIHTNPEIQSLYEMLISTIESSNKLQHEFEITSEKLESVEGKVYVDALTGLGNKHSYEMKLKEFQEKIDKGESLNVAIAVADVNNLKYVNDTFGHEKGDEYIRGCCQILSETFGEKNIHRIGGDEFVIFIENEEFTSRYINLSRAEERFAARIENKGVPEYERYSASLGIANFKTDSDKTLIEVVKEADRQMYEKKNIFKKKYGSYR